MSPHLLLAEAHGAADWIHDGVLLAVSGTLSVVAAVLWWLLRRSVAEIDRRQNDCDTAQRLHDARLARHDTRIAVIEDRLRTKR
jgi:hypothetical protein